MDPEIKN
jgi:hypothetical protein